jgi:hypothetical protein
MEDQSNQIMFSSFQFYKVFMSARSENKITTHPTKAGKNVRLLSWMLS